MKNEENVTQSNETPDDVHEITSMSFWLFLDNGN
jgi:hypothetical protein